MSEQQHVSEPFNEKLRLIRFRMKKEHLRFSDEIRLIAAQVTALIINLSGIRATPWPEGYNETVASVALAGIVTAFAIPSACLLFLIGYVNHDAKRRGMNSALWTLLVIILLPAYVATGFIIYFLMREPLPYSCPECGATVSARFNFCPRCKCNLRPTCPQCKREVSEADHYCPHCAYELAAAGGQTEPSATGSTGHERSS
jgi:hypothetical protein